MKILSDEQINEIVNDIDPNNQTLSVKVTDTDIKIFIKVILIYIFNLRHILV